MIWFFFGTSNRMPIFLANLVDLYFTVLLGTPDALIGKLRFIYSFFFFRDDFELLEVFGHCISIPVELTS